MIKRVMRIDEDVDFGCEERMDNSPAMVIVTLQDEDGTKHQIRVADQFLYDSDISEGDRILLDADGMIHKVV